VTNPVVVRDAVVVRGGRTTLDHVDFECSPGEFVAVLGPNGAGKTTLINALLGLLPLQSGSVKLFGTPLRQFHDWSRLGYVPQRPAATPGVPATVLEVAMLGRLARSRLVGPWGRGDADAAKRALATVGLAERANDSAATLSGGQQQRLRVARALTTVPDMLVLDEPFSWVDVPTEADLVRTLAEFRAGGGAVLFVAHDLHAVEGIVDRVVVLRDGRLAAEGPPAELEIGAPEHRHEHEPPL
jgi:zinc transport system ATP-binding protein